MKWRPEFCPHADEICNDIVRAAQLGHDSCINTMLLCGANVDEIAPDGSTALMMASKGSHFKCLEILLQNGANVLYENQRGETALYFAEEGGKCHNELVKYREKFHRGIALKRTLKDSSYIELKVHERDTVELYQAYSKKLKDENFKMGHILNSNVTNSGPSENIQMQNMDEWKDLHGAASSFRCLPTDIFNVSSSDKWRIYVGDRTIRDDDNCCYPTDLFYIYSCKYYPKQSFLRRRTSRRHISRMEWCHSILRICKRFRIRKLHLHEPTLFFLQGQKFHRKQDDQRKVHQHRFQHKHFTSIPLSSNRLRLWKLLQQLLIEHFPEYDDLPIYYWDLEQWEDCYNVSAVGTIARMLYTLENDGAVDCRKQLESCCKNLSSDLQSRLNPTLQNIESFGELRKYSHIFERNFGSSSTTLYLTRNGKSLRRLVEEYKAAAMDDAVKLPLESSAAENIPEEVPDSVLFHIYRDDKKCVSFATFQTVALIPDLLNQYNTIICVDEIRENESVLILLLDCIAPVYFFSYDYKEFHPPRFSCCLSLEEHVHNLCSFLDACSQLRQLQNSFNLSDVPIDALVHLVWSSAPVSYRSDTIEDILKTVKTEYPEELIRPYVELCWSLLFDPCRTLRSQRVKSFFYSVDQSSTVHMTSPGWQIRYIISMDDRSKSEARQYASVLKMLLEKDLFIFTDPFEQLFQVIGRRMYAQEVGCKKGHLSRSDISIWTSSNMLLLLKNFQLESVSSFAPDKEVMFSVFENMWKRSVQEPLKRLLHDQIRVGNFSSVDFQYEDEADNMKLRIPLDCLAKEQRNMICTVCLNVESEVSWMKWFAKYWKWLAKYGKWPPANLNRK